MKYNFIIIGSGITGLVLAERITSLTKKNILIIEKRNHIGGNCYDSKDKHGILIHKYGPHIFHTNYQIIWEYLSRFTGWNNYQHKVLGFVDGNYIPIPFNLNSLHKLLPSKLANKLEIKLLNYFGYDKKIPILELIKTKDKDLSYLANIVYEKIFLHYTEKQWGFKPEEIDDTVTARVPVVISHDDRYFHDKYQGIPLDGYTKMIEKMIKNKNIEVQLGKDFKDVKNDIKSDVLFYTGPIDEFFDYQFGKLDYRCVNINLQTKDIDNYQQTAVVNYPNDYDYTRITEFKKFAIHKNRCTTIGYEYPGDNGFIAWPLISKRNKEIFKKYWKEAEKLKKYNIFFVGRLAEFKYYDMDDAVLNSLNLFDRMKDNSF
jgi:UDP-galactopyranose mutase